MSRPVIHLILHALVPGIVARIGFPKRWWVAWLIMVATMLVDLDHLLADPLYNPDRCSIGFHPLHTIVPIISYIALTALPVTRLIGLGLVIHMVLDLIDCIGMGLFTWDLLLPW